MVVVSSAYGSSGSVIFDETLTEAYVSNKSSKKAVALLKPSYFIDYPTIHYAKIARVSRYPYVRDSVNYFVA